MNPLAEVLPPAVRKYTYAVVFVLAVVFTIWQAAEGNWLEFGGGVLAALVNLLATSNTPSEYDGTIDPYAADAVTPSDRLQITTDKADAKKTVTLVVEPSENQ